MYICTGTYTVEIYLPELYGEQKLHFPFFFFFLTVQSCLYLQALCKGKARFLWLEK